MARAKKAVAVVEAAPENETTHIAASAIQPIPFARLKRAPENVRHTNIAADVESLADDIAAHGLLQSLIGYAGDTSIDKAVVYIVGGGRRLQALDLLHDRGLIGDDWPVSVLLRAPDEAIELSLSENLARRDMNPADEFVAFAQLMKPGTLSTADLATRFGFAERYVKQRLRLADLAPDILDALRDGKMTLDSAMAYAKSQSHEIQMKVFRAQSKSNWKPHDAASVAQAYLNEQMTTGDALFKFVTARDYEKAGGAYEDDLFAALTRYDGERQVKDAGIVLSIAGQRAPFQLDRIKSEAKAQHPTTIDVLLAPGIRRGKTPKAPAGCKIVERDYNSDDYATMRDRATKVGALITGIASVDHSGKLTLEERFFVPTDRMGEVNPPRRDARPVKTQAEIEAERRLDAIRSVAAVLAVRSLTEAATEGRRFFTSGRPWLGRTEEVEGLGEVYGIGQTYYVKPDEVDAHLDAAGGEYDRQEAEKAAGREASERAKAEAAERLEARRVEVLAMDPPPVAIVVEGMTFFRWESGVYCEQRESADADPDYGYDDVAEMVDGASAIGMTWSTIEAWEANPHGDNDAETVDDVDQAA